MNFTDHISQNDTPLVFKNVINSWPASKWNLEILAETLGNKILKCKIGQRSSEESVFETDCFYQDVTVSDFVNWCDGNNVPENPLSHVDKSKYFCYIDYKYMPEIFTENDELLQTIDWGDFGLTERDGKDSTLWIGSEGAFTPCHYDTYGFNLVAQIYGRKRWTLFPPSDSSFLYPTRVPYEESSVFSGVNIKLPNLDKHPNFVKCTPYIVTLGPGDVLYVPKRWWHFVESIEPSISVNTWVEIEDDKETRVKEAISRLLFSCIHSNLRDCLDTSDWVNPNEELQATSVNLAYLKKATEGLIDPPSRHKLAFISSHFTLFCEKFKFHSVLPQPDLIVNEEGDLTRSDDNSETEDKSHDSNPKKRKKSFNDGRDVVIFEVQRGDITDILKSTQKFPKHKKSSTLLSETQKSTKQPTSSTSLSETQKLQISSTSLSEAVQTNEKLSKRLIQSILDPDIIQIITQKYLNDR